MEETYWERIGALFGQAMERPPAQRRAYVEQACAGDATLEAEVLSLLASYEQATGYFQSLAGSVVAPAISALVQDRHRSDRVGQTVGHYRITGVLGGGGMGVVYRAHDLRLGRTVALKFLPPELTRDSEARARLVREAQTASALDNPNLCTIYGIDETDEGQVFIAMACYEGQTLQEMIARGPLPVAQCIEIARQAARGLAHAHRNGITHRDVKHAYRFLGWCRELPSAPRVLPHLRSSTSVPVVCLRS